MPGTGALGHEGRAPDKGAEHQQKANFCVVYSSADALHFHQTVEVVTAGIVGNGQRGSLHSGSKVADVQW